MSESKKSKEELMAEITALYAQLAEYNKESPHQSAQVPQDENNYSRHYKAQLEELERVAKLGYFAVNFRDHTIRRSAGVKRISGIDDDYPSDILGWLALIHPDHRPMMEEYMVNDVLIQRKKLDREYKIIHQESGQMRWVHALGDLRYDRNGKLIELFGTLQDITERKKAEEALLNSERTYQDLIDSMNETLWVISLDGRFIDVNRTAVERLRYTREELLQMGPNDIDRHVTPEIVDELIRGMQRNHQQIIETIHTAKDGENIPVEIQSTLVNYHGTDAILSIARDITARKEAEIALRQSEARNRLLATVVTQTTESIVVTDTLGVITYVNPAYERLTGYHANEVIGQRLPIFDEASPDSADELSAWKTVQSGTTWSGQYLNSRRDGSSYEEEASIFAIYDTENQPTNYCKIGRDVSHEVQLERQLRQAQKLETIGTLAGGIAHDFNNILTPILGYAEMATTMLPPADPLQANLQRIVQGASRARNLISQILTFSRQTEQKQQPLCLQMIIEEALQLIQPTIPTTIEVDRQIDSSCGKVMADATQLHQVLLNLCTNALHAMEESTGTLTISLEQVNVTPALIQLHPNLNQGPHAKLTVRDSGSGMDQKTIDRIFEPFFTTKSVNRGTGLGLSVVHGIIHAHEGALHVESEVGKGSAFQLYLPIYQNQRANPPDTSSNAPRGQEKILLVDDESAVVDVLTMMLNQLGYQVDAYCHSDAALEHFKSATSNYNLLISDLTMPRMNGLELSTEIQQIRPGLPTILITGYGDHINETTLKHHGITTIIGKPIRYNELAVVMRQVLEGHAGFVYKQVGA